jgi:hypothetical protein
LHVPALATLLLQSVQHRGTLFTTALEYWGVEELRLPSIYYGMFDVSKLLCRVHRSDWGLIASRDGLALSYPVIGARADGNALVAYSYSGGSEQLPNNAGPAYAGGCERATNNEAAVAATRATP